ncbi:acyl carrier protein [Streptomyces sp. KR55]|uniref:acyl carrier protein n=1 Tax=Streptomyces sp. KR55 TaxID=3457425 RepID=UPI003FD5918F
MDQDQLATRLEETKHLVNTVRLATATVFVEGPPSILEPAKRVEDGLILFHTAMTAVATRPAGTSDESIAAYHAICREERVGVRTALMDFASAARSVLDGDSSQTPPPEHAPARESTEELSWLIDGVANALGAPRTDINADTTLSANGLDSLSAVELVHFLRREHGLVLEGSWFFGMWDQTLRQVSGHLAALRAGDN